MYVLLLHKSKELDFLFQKDTGGISVLPRSRIPRLSCMLFRIYFSFVINTPGLQELWVYCGRICGVPSPSRERYKAYNIKNMPVPKHVEHMVLVAMPPV